MLKLSRVLTFIIGAVAIVLFYISNRTNQLFNSDRVEGRIIHYVEVDTSIELGKTVYPFIGFVFENKEHTFYGPEYGGFDKNEPIPLLIKNKNTKEPVIYTFRYFWLYPLVYCLPAMAIWAAFALSYIDKTEQLLVNVKYPFFKKEKNIHLPVIH